MENRDNEIKIIAELSPQHGASFSRLIQMCEQAVFGGADILKLQLYSSQNLFESDRKKHLEITLEELREFLDFCDSKYVTPMCSIFDEERLDWCLSENMYIAKIASRTFGHDTLCEKIISSFDTTFISNSHSINNFKYGHEKTKYLYCVSEYPTLLERVFLPEFKEDGYVGYSDHTYGLTAAKTAIVKGAKYIEKHFTLSKGRQQSLQMGHLGAMDLQDLISLRNFADEFSLLGTEKQS